MIDTVLMDLDGTLLPFEQDDFLKVYFGLLCEQLCPLGYSQDDVIHAIWNGTKQMMQNDGSVYNAVRFWDGFAACLGDRIRDEEERLDRFYETDFHRVRQVVKGDSAAKDIVHTLKNKGYTVVLATNPLFPISAQQSRLSWLGLTVEDFAFVTHYENSHFCKPDLRYYEEILRTIGKTPSQCLMIGNSVAEDMVAQTLGMTVYLVNTYLENPKGLPTASYEQGSLDEVLGFIARIESEK